jgi:hypothetical protein
MELKYSKFLLLVLLGSSEIERFSLLGPVRIFKGGWMWNWTSFENLMQARSLFHTPQVTNSVRNTAASSEYIFLKAHPYTQHICKFQQSWNNINNIISVQLFIKWLVRYFEHLDSLGLGHANRLKSWVGCKILCVCL